MYFVSDSVSLFGATTTSLGSGILYVLGVVVAAWAGFVVLRWALYRVGILLVEGFRGQGFTSKSHQEFLDLDGRL